MQHDPFTTRYREVNSRKPWFVWPLISLFAILTFLGMVLQLFAGMPLGGPRPTFDWVLVLLVVTFVFFAPVFVSAMRVETTVTDDTLTVRFRPLYTRRIPRSEIISATPVTYRPIRDYGGWGIRYTPWAGSAINLSGNRGVMLELTRKRRLLVGSETPEQLADALRPPEALAA